MITIILIQPIHEETELCRDNGLLNRKSERPALLWAGTEQSYRQLSIREVFGYESDPILQGRQLGSVFGVVGGFC